jgi:hypothetical protein
MLSASRVPASPGLIDVASAILQSSAHGRLGLPHEARTLAFPVAKVRRRIKFGALLRKRTHDHETQGLRELAQLGQRCLEFDIAYARQLNGRNDCALPLIFCFLQHGARSLSDHVHV